MLLNANRMSTNIIVTVLVLVMVFLLPLLDRRICARLGINLHHGVSSNPNADTLLEIRQLLLFGVFFIYLMVFAYLVCTMPLIRITAFSTSLWPSSRRASRTPFPISAW